MSEPEIFATIFASVTLAAMVQGLSGFGFGLTMMSIARVTSGASSSKM